MSDQEQNQEPIHADLNEAGTSFRDPETGRFLQGNQFWKARSKHGRDKIFSTPEDLWNACLEYFDWVSENPLYAAETVKYMGHATLKAVPKMRAMSLSSMCLFFGVTLTTWYDYKDREEYAGVCEMAERVMFDYKFNGAAADMLNANIIARDLGLVDKSDIKQNATVNGDMKWIIEIVDPEPRKD